MPVDVGSAVGYLDLDTSKFKKGFDSALKDLSVFESKTATASDKLTAMGSAMGSAGSTMTKSVTLPLVGIGTAFVATAGKFESSMSQVQATMGITKDTMVEVNGESVNAMEALSDVAQKMGATTKFSASEAAEGLNYMALAGYDVQTSMDMLPTVLQLAAAGSMELGSASDMVTDAQTALGLSLEETTTLVDQMAKTASSSNTSVAQLGDAILTIGGTAKFMAGGTEELNTVLGVLADNGIKAGEAGTHLRNMLLKLSDPTDAGANAIENLGLQIYDSEGHMRKFADIFGDLNTAMSDFTDEEKVQTLSALFNTRDVAAATALMDTSAERWAELQNQIEGAWYSSESLGKELKKLGLDLNKLQTNAFKDLGVSAEDFNSILASSNGNAQNFIDSLWEASDSGVEYSDVLKAMGGDLKSLQEAFDNTQGAAGQMAETQLDNLTGQLTILKSSTEGMAIAFGNLMLPAIKKVTEAIQGIVDWINNLSESQKKVVLVIASTIAAIGPLLLVGSKLIKTGLSIAKVVKNIGAVTTALTGPIGIVIAVVAALALAWATDFGGIREFTEKFVGKVVELFTTLWEKATEIWDNNLYGIQTIVTTVIDIIETTFSSLFDIILGAMDVFMGLFTGDWEKVKEGLGEMLDGLVNLVTGIGESLWNAGREIFGKLWDGLKNKWEDIKGWVEDKVDWLVDKLKFWEDSTDSISKSMADTMEKEYRGSSYTTNTSNTYNFYSPKALTPSETAAAFNKTTSRMLLGF